MRLTKSIFAGAALALAFGTAHAADNKEQARDVPGFNEMDKDDDGALTRAEAAGNPQLLARFGEVDRDGDGKLTRYEYLRAMAKEDFNSVRERVAGFIEPEEESATSGATKQRR